MAQFIEINGAVVNVDHISHINFQHDGTAMIHVGANSIAVEGDDVARVVGSIFGKLPPAPASDDDAETPSRHEDLVEIQHLRKQLDGALATIRDLNSPPADAEPLAPESLGPQLVPTPAAQIEEHAETAEAADHIGSADE